MFPKLCAASYSLGHHENFPIMIITLKHYYHIKCQLIQHKFDQHFYVTSTRVDFKISEGGINSCFHQTQPKHDQMCSSSACRGNIERIQTHG